MFERLEQRCRIARPHRLGRADCANGNTSASLDGDVSVREYIARRLKMADLSFLMLGDAILIQQIEMAQLDSTLAVLRALRQAEWWFL